MSPLTRSKRLISPHGVFQLPKSAVSLSTAPDSDSNSWSSDGWSPYRPTSSPQYTATDVATESVDHRRSQRRSTSNGAASFVLSGLVRGARSQAVTRDG